MRENLKKNQAITLVSLVVTIIILIILAGVSINLILGKNGIITIAKQAKENTELAKTEEEIALNELYMQIEAEGGSTGDISYDAITELVEFKRKIASAITDMGIETSESASVDTMASNIRSISGASSADEVSYDNTNSGLAAINVQSAVDELNNSIKTQLPDYNNYSIPFSSDITSNTTYTAPSDGILFLYAEVSGESTISAFINGIYVAQFSDYGAIDTRSIERIPMCKGDSININVSGGKISGATRFVPYK